MNSPVEKVAENLYETEQISSKPNEEKPNTTKEISMINEDPEAENYRTEDKEKEELIAYLKKVLEDASNREINSMNEDYAAETEMEMQLAYEKITEFKKNDPELQELKKQVLGKCGRYRRMGMEEKRRAIYDMRRVATPADLIKVAYIIAENKGIYLDKTKNAFAIDENEEDDLVFWELKFFLKGKKLVSDADRVKKDVVPFSGADSSTSDFRQMDDIDEIYGFSWKN